MREMISFKGERANFNFRAAAVAFDKTGEHVLIHRAITDPFWAMPGGRVELLESSADAIKREMAEELSTFVTVERLLWVVENYFVYNDRKHHELAFYFLISFPVDSPIYDHQEAFSGDEEGLELIYQWWDVNHLDEAPLVPSFLRKGLRSLPESIQYVVHTDTGE